MVDHISNREVIINSVREELIGPAPDGQELDTTNLPISFPKSEDAYGPFVEKGTGEEIIQRDTPTKRYGVGVLFPFGSDSKHDEKVTGADSVGLGSSDIEGSENGSEGKKRDDLISGTDKGLDRLSNSIRGDDFSNDFDLSLANSYQQSSIGISFLAELPEDSKLMVIARGGRYRDLPVVIAGFERTWYVRSGIEFIAEFASENIVTKRKCYIGSSKENSTNTEGLQLNVEVYSRPSGENPNIRLLTICLVNRTDTTGSKIDDIVFQASFKLKIVKGDHSAFILPYPRPPFKSLDDEEKSLELLYRKSKTFAVGHGCAANWGNSNSERADWVAADCLPVFETPSITPDIFDENKNPITASMATLAGLNPKDDGFSVLNRIVKSYEDWIDEKEKEISTLDFELQETAKKHLLICRNCAKRMYGGIEFLKNNTKALRAFRLANHAILLQQLHSRSEVRKASYDEKAKRIVFSEDYAEPDTGKIQGNRGTWRAFQIAFLLMTIKPAIDISDPERDTVELIWFPTGGGKTEAYLGLTAFTLFYRRLVNSNDIGTHVIMRYTLRLLTTQQFQRASRLICAMESIRKDNIAELGRDSFTIGLWVGEGNTPNRRDGARSILKGLIDGNKQVENKFLLDRCPWCGAQLGPLEDENKKGKSRGSVISGPRVIGYVESSGTVIFKCPEPKCEFKNGLPIYVIDEDIYDSPPSVVIGTVDKFAMLAWKPEARVLFGIDKKGIRKNSPPGLIIQDELHLISGPLGSLVGLFEAVIEELCTDRRYQEPIRPKIISSTATIRRYETQVKALYARNKVVLFPPPGLEEGDSFFGRYATDEQGALLPGRKYVGVNAPGLSSMQTVQVRAFTALLQAPMTLPDDGKDPWWTLLIFFNSLRELGTTLSLVQSDIPDYQQVMMHRLASRKQNWRNFNEVKELTGRASSEDVPKAIAALEKKYPGDDKQKVIDICLASNILEVGIDIDRLGLISIVGQPKTTSQYIQVTGRVGRSWKDRPGLVITLYSSSKPRDRSHFEKFRSYHEKLYAQVEPTSVTPFSPPVLERALHAVMVTYVIQMGDENIQESPYPFPKDLIDDLRKILLPRVEAIDPQEVDNFERVFDERKKEWKRWGPINWSSSSGDPNILIRPAGAYASDEQKLQSWATMQSMRSVDSECVTELVNPNQLEGDNEDA